MGVQGRKALHYQDGGFWLAVKLLEKADIVAYGRLSLDKLESVWRIVSTVVVPSIWEEPAPYVVVEALLRGKLP